MPRGSPATPATPSRSGRGPSAHDPFDRHYRPPPQFRGSELVPLIEFVSIEVRRDLLVKKEGTKKYMDKQKFLGHKAIIIQKFGNTTFRVQVTPQSNEDVKEWVRNGTRRFEVDMNYKLMVRISYKEFMEDWIRFIKARNCIASQIDPRQARHAAEQRIEQLLRDHAEREEDMVNDDEEADPTYQPESDEDDPLVVDEDIPRAPQPRSLLDILGQVDRELTQECKAAYAGRDTSTGVNQALNAASAQNQIPPPDSLPMQNMQRLHVLECTPIPVPNRIGQMVLDYPIEYVFDEEDQGVFEVWALFIGYAAGMMRGFGGRTALLVEQGQERVYNHMQPHTREYNADEQRQEPVMSAANLFPEVVENLPLVARAPTGPEIFDSSSSELTETKKCKKKKAGRKSA